MNLVLMEDVVLDRTGARAFMDSPEDGVKLVRIKKAVWYDERRR